MDNVDIAYWPVMTPAVMYNSVMELVKELVAIPIPLSSPPSMTVARQPNLSTNALQKGPGR